MNQKKILLFGGSGFLGSKLQNHFPFSGLTAPTHKELDLLNIQNVSHFIENNNPQAIIYAAGITKIDSAEENNELAYLLNHRIPEKIAKFVSKNNIPFIYISTDAVFDGYKNKYQFLETD